MDPITRKLVETVRQITEQHVAPPSTRKTMNPPPAQPEQPGIPYQDPMDVWNTHQNNLLRITSNTAPNPVPLSEPPTKYYNPSLDDITGFGKIKKIVTDTLNSEFSTPNDRAKLRDSRFTPTSPDADLNLTTSVTIPPIPKPAANAPKHRLTVRGDDPTVDNKYYTPMAKP
jgi:hypothetical protein